MNKHSRPFSERLLSGVLKVDITDLNAIAT